MWTYYSGGFISFKILLQLTKKCCYNWEDYFASSTDKVLTQKVKVALQISCETLLNPLLCHAETAEDNLETPGSCKLWCKWFWIMNTLSEESHDSCPSSKNTHLCLWWLVGCLKLILGTEHLCNDEDSLDSLLNKFPEKTVTSGSLTLHFPKSLCFAGVFIYVLNNLILPVSH